MNEIQKKACYGNPIIRNPYPGLLETEVFTPNTHPGAAWFPDAAFGLFIHWGISAADGNYDLSWGMMKRKPHSIDERVGYYGVFTVTRPVPPNVYWARAKEFDAKNYNPDKWLSAAKKAGIEYAVLTTRHHDGFALWPSKYGDFNTKTHLGGRDLVREYVDACRRNGLKVGFYYSPPDWYMEREWMNYSLEEGVFLDADWNPVEPRVIPLEEKRKIREYNRNQVEELLTEYGQIDLLWFDCVYGSDCIPLSRIRELQPGIVVNNRGRAKGDFLSADEGSFPKERHDGMWDYCDVFSADTGAWGYLNHEVYNPSGWVLENLAKTRSWSGNFLINAGPDAHGEMPAVYYDRMAELAGWMKQNGESVKKASGTDFWPERCNVPVTRNGKTLFLHVHWRVDYPVEFNDIDEPVSLTLNGKALPYQYENRTLSFDLPEGDSGLLTRIVRFEEKT